MKRLLVTIYLAILWIPAVVHAQQTQPVTMAPIAGPIYMLQGSGGNIGVIADPAGVFIDAH